MDRYLDILARGRCRTIFAYPSSMYLLAQHAQRRFHAPKPMGRRIDQLTWMKPETKARAWLFG